MRGRRSDARNIVHAHGISDERLGIVLGVTQGQVFKYLTGARRVGPAHLSALVSEYGDTGRLIFDACHHAWLVRNPETPVCSPAKSVERDVSGAADDDGVRIPIVEWRARFGEPGSGADVHGRMGGVFASEPCFLGE